MKTNTATKMKTFKITWENCHLQTGTTKIKASSATEAEQIFGKDFGIDYIIICIG